MAVIKSTANAGKKTHESKPTSSLSKHVSVTKPEGRHPTKHSYSEAGAKGILKKHFG